MAFIASTKRNPSASGGKVGKAVTKLATLTLAFEPLPAGSKTVEFYKLQSPRKSWVTGVYGNPDVLEGDLLSYGGLDYRVSAIGKFVGPVGYTKIVMEQVR